MTDHDPEARAYARAAALQQHLAETEAGLKSFDAVIRFSELAIKSLLLLCGGAAVAVLSFAGSRGATTQVSLDEYALAVHYFGMAAGGAVATAGLSYLGQCFFTKDWDRCGATFQALSIIVWLLSLAVFYVGVSHASAAVSLSRWQNIEIKP